MESKMKMMSSLMEDLPRPSMASFRSSSPFRTNNLATGGHATSSRHQVDPNAPLSCVTRETSQQDCARHRFIVWTAVKRNSSTRMPTEKRLECPLLHCNRRFRGHETMLGHLAECEFLSSGEYWCYDHMRVERFDDLKCKRCLGHPSKRKKMLSMAKSFFHSLGHKSKKVHGYESFEDDDGMEPPPTYESISPLDATELSPDNQILEIDSIEVSTVAPVPHVEGPTTAIDPQALLVPELDSTALSAEPFIQHAMQWQPTPLINTSAPITSPDESETRSPTGRPSLQLNTFGLQGLQGSTRPIARPKPVQTVPRSTKGLTPSSSVRSTASTDSNASTNSNFSSLISPISNWSGAWSLASGHNTNLTSPVDAISPSRLLADNPFADNDGACDPCPNFLHDFYSELPADPAPQELPDVLSSDTLLMCLDPPVTGDASYATNLVLTEDSGNLIELDESDTEESNVCCSETKTLIASAWDALQEHIVSSMLKIQQSGGNPLADQLRAMSTKTIATVGLKTLRSLLDGNQPSSAIDTLCFIHLVYAFSLAVHEQETSTKAKDLFLRSLLYSMSFTADTRSLYSQLVCNIWQPADVTQADINAYFTMTQTQSLSRSSSLKGKQPDPARQLDAYSDTLLTAARNYLDELECSLLLGQPPSSPVIQTSDLYTKHLLDLSTSMPPQDSPFAVTVRFVTEVLNRDFSDGENLASKFSHIYQRVNSGSISTVRKVEVELLQAGKDYMTTDRYFGDFVPAVRKLCDPIYSQHCQGLSRRNDYHALGISLIESIMPEVDNTDSQPAAPISEEHDPDLEQFLNNISTGSFANITARSYSPLTAMPYEPTFDSDMICSIADAMAIPTPAETAESLISSPPSSFQTRQTPSPIATPPQQASLSTQQQQSDDAQKAAANSCCEICGYRPKGDPQWFKGSMSKHKKLQHSAAPPKIYKCPFPGCTSAYKNRPDNLRQHQIEKKHFVDGEEGSARPAKKRKRAPMEGEE